MSKNGYDYTTPETQYCGDVTSQIVKQIVLNVNVPISNLPELDDNTEVVIKVNDVQIARLNHYRMERVIGKRL